MDFKVACALRQKWCEAPSSRVGLGVPLRVNQGGSPDMCREVTFRRFSDVPRIRTEITTVVSNISKVADSISVLVSFQTRRFVLSLAPFWRLFCVNLEIFMKSTELDRGSSLIVLSVHFNVYKHVQNSILRCVFSYVFLDVCVLWTSESSCGTYNWIVGEVL